MTLGPTYPQPHEDADGMLVPQILEHGPTLPSWHSQPSGNWPKGRFREMPDLVELCQLQSYLIAGLLKELGKTQFTCDSHYHRMTEVRVTIDDLDNVTGKVVTGGGS